MELINITYKQLRENNYLSEYNDQYGLAAFINDNVRNTFLSSPNNDDSKTAILLAIDNGDIVGRSIIYETPIKNKNHTIKAQSFGSIEVDNSQRGKGIGTLIARFSLNNNEYPIFLCSLLLILSDVCKRRSNFFIRKASESKTSVDSLFFFI